jgi:hypothetical protein
MDASVREAARVMQQAGGDMAGPFATRTAEMQLCLPLRLWPAHPLPHTLCRGSPAIFRPFDRPHCAILQLWWETLKTTAADLCSPETATLQAALEPGSLVQAQHSFGHHDAQHAY